MVRPSIPVLCYHNVSHADGHTPVMFREHLDAIRDAGFHTISSGDLLRIVRGQNEPEPRSVVLTFDDGHLSNWLHAVPELEAHGMTGTFFALTGLTPPGAPRTPADAPPLMTMPDAFRTMFATGDASQLINEGEIKAMLDRGMEIFSHGGHHQGCFRTLRPVSRMGDRLAHWAAWSIYREFDENWPAFNPEWPVFDVASAYAYNGFWPVPGSDGPTFRLRTEAERRDFCRRDFTRSMERIRELNGRDEQLFCYPWGQFDPVARQELERAGFAGAFTLERWHNGPGTDPFRLNRIGVGKSKDGDWIARRLRMYSNAVGARAFFKFQRRKPEVSTVLYATDSDRLSGGSRQMINNAAAMHEMGVRVLAVVPSDSPLAAPLAEAGAEVVPFDGFRSYLGAARFLKSLVKRERVDVVHTFHNRAYKMAVLARLMGAGCKVFVNRGVVSRPNDVFFLWTAPASGVICNSLECAKVLGRHRVRPKLLNVVYNAYCGPDQGPRPEQEKRGLRVLYMGNGAPAKGFDVFLDAMAELCATGRARDMEFVVVGLPHDQLPGFIDHLTPQVNQRLRLTGELPHAQVLEELRFADVLVVSSRLESLPNVILEAFDAGAAVVACGVGGIPELILHKVNGLLCEAENAKCLADGVDALARDVPARWRMARTGRRVVRSLLSRRVKGMALMRVYMGEHLSEPLDIRGIAQAEERHDPVD